MRSYIKGLAIAAVLTVSICAGCQSSFTSIPPPSVVATSTPSVIPPGQSVTFCDLISSPELYNNKIVRTQAIAVATSELSFLYDPQCNRDEPWIDLQFDSQQTLEKVAPLVDVSKGRHVPRRAKVTLVGHFQGPSKDGFGHLSSFRFHFRAVAVESAETVPEDVPGPWAGKKRITSNKKK